MTGSEPGVSRTTSGRGAALAASVTLAALSWGCGEPATGGLGWEARGEPASATVHARGQRDVESLLSDIRRTIDAAGENLAGTEVWIRVRDNGPGIPEAAQSEVFSPFYTSKAGGNGLGLAISKKVVDAHGGAIEVDSKPGQGCEFTVTFPKRAGGRAPAR